MQLTDHYRVLGLEPDATLAEIKKAYRQLALALHPDKSSGDPYARERFEAVKLAYEVLTDPRRRSAYLQERWLAQSRGQKMNRDFFTPELLLRQVLELDRYSRQLDAHRLDRQGLAQHMLDLLNPETIQKIRAFDDLYINRQIVFTMLRCCELLERREEAGVLSQLKKIPLGPGNHSMLAAYEKKRSATHRWNRWKTWLVLISVILLCLLIYFASGVD